MAEQERGDVGVAIQKKYKELQEVERNTHRFGTVLTLAILAVIVGYLYGFYKRGQSMYSPEKFKPELQEATDRLMPQVRKSLEYVIREAGPVYFDASREVVRESLPMLRAGLSKEWKKMEPRLRILAEEEFRSALARVEEKFAMRMKDRFPELASDEAQAQFLRKWQETLDIDTREMLDKFYAKYEADIERMRLTAEQFRPNRFEDYGQETLSRYFVHLWLLLLDQQIMGSEGMQEVHLGQ